MSQSGTPFASVELVGYSPRADFGGQKFVIGWRFDSRQNVVTRDGKGEPFLEVPACS
jgi:hypothetical protein